MHRWKAHKVLILTVPKTHFSIFTRKAWFCRVRSHMKICTSSTRPEVHNVSHCRLQNKTNPWPEVYRQFWKIWTCAVYAVVVCPCVCLSIRHKPVLVLYQNG